jgi:hypothetical protein
LAKKASRTACGARGNKPHARSEFGDRVPRKDQLLERPDCWHVYYGDVNVGTIAVRPGVPADVNQ